MPVAADFRSAEAIRDPYGVLRRLQRDDPVHWNEGLSAWCLSTYRDVEAGFKDPRLSSDRIRPFAAAQGSRDGVAVLGDCLSLWMVFNDPPTHTRLRALVAQAFSRRAVEALRPKIAATVDELIDAAAPAGAMDAIADFAYPLPAIVIADMLGVPRRDVDALKRWSDDIAKFVLAARNTPDRYEVAAASLAAMLDYFAQLVTERRARPGEDIIDSLIAAHEGEDRLTLPELLSSCVLLLFAGHETTTHFLANGLRALALHPDAREGLAEQPGDGPAWRGAINEMLRWDGPSISQLRVASDDLEWGGRRIARGERVYLFIAGANHDDAVFPNPGRFDVSRPNAARQLAFGSGIHLCLGAHLARLEGEVAFPVLCRRLGAVTLDAPEADWTDSLVIRSMHAMPIRFAPGPASRPA